MGRIKEVLPAKLIIGLIARKEALETALAEIESAFGPIDAASDVIPFDWTNYYEDEMGKDLLRQWVSVKGLVAQESLPDIKLKTNDIEMAHAVDGRRNMNLDPGFILHSKLVLATTKDYSHRIYVGKGIYAEVTLIYRKKVGFEPLPWTYPDYRSELARSFFNRVRARYMEELKPYLAQRANIDHD